VVPVLAKTVVAMHRTAWLAQRLADAGEPGRVLFTTFTRNLATDIRSNLTKICSTEALQRIEVIHLDGWVMNFLKNQGLQVRVFDDQARDSCWSLAMDVADTTLGLMRTSTARSGRKWCWPMAAAPAMTT